MAVRKSIVLRKEINHVLYELMVKTITSQVYNEDESKTLDRLLSELNTAVSTKADASDLTALEARFNALVKDAPEAYDTLKEFVDYITSHKTEYDSLMSIAAGKVDKVDGKGLSSNDFDNELKEKLDALYTAAQIDGKITAATAGSNMYCVPTIAKRDELEVGAGVLCYVYKTSDDDDVTGATFQKLADGTWAPFHGSITNDDMISILNYVKDNLESSIYEVDNEIEYLTLH